MSTEYIRLPIGGVPVYSSLAAFPVSAPNGSLAVDGSTDILYIYSTTAMMWEPIGGTAVPLGVGPIDSQPPSANGLVIANNLLYAQSASITVPGMVNDAAQSFAGNKIFTGTIAASNLSGTNTGDVTLSAVGSSPNANAATLTGQVLNLQPFNSANPGVATASGGGTVNFLRADGTWTAPTGTAGITALTGDVTATGPGSVPATLATVNGNVGTFGSASSVPTFTVNAKGLITAASANAVIAPAGTLSGTTLASNVVTSSLTSLGIQSQALNMGSHLIDNVTDPVSAQDAATKNYVDMVASGIQPIQAVYAATTGSNIPGTYLNGAAGVGATFTTTSVSTFTVDGVTPPLNSRVLIKDQSSGFQNGVYNITQVATGVLPTIFTRSLDFNTAANMNAGNLIPVINGTLNSQTSWLQTATINTVGTDSLVFIEWTANPANYLLKANNLSDVASKPASYNNISPMTTTGDIEYEVSANTAARLPIGSTGDVLTVAGGVPTWAPAGAGSFPGTNWNSALTFTTNNLGSTNNNFWSRRVGDSLEIRGSFTSTTPNSAVGLINMPAGLTIDSSKFSASSDIQVVGFANVLPVTTAALFSAGGTGIAIVYDGSTTSSVYMSFQASSNTYNQDNTNNYIGAGFVISFLFTVPITQYAF